MTSPRAIELGEGGAGYREAVWSEWTKFRTVRSTLAVTAVLGAMFPIFAVIVAATESLQPDDTILGASLLGGAVLAQVIAAALGASLITTEFKSGMIRTTLAACPRRLVVLAAKATVAAGVVVAVTLPSATAAFAVGRVMLDGDTYATGDPFPALLGVVLAIASIAVLGVGVGTIVRHSAGAVTAVIGVVLLPGLLAPLLGDLQRWLGGASLNGVLQKLTQSSDATHDAVGSLGAWPALAVVAAYTTATVLGAVWVLRHRDT
jgi:ABC-2 type transport system permease protein